MKKNSRIKFGLITYSPIDRSQDFSRNIYWDTPHAHPPNSWHSFCAATNGKFYNVTEPSALKQLSQDIPETILFSFSQPNFYLFDVYPKLAVKMKKSGAKVFLGFHENFYILNEIIKKNASYLKKIHALSEHFDAYINTNFSDYNLFWEKTTGLHVFNWYFCFPTQKIKFPRFERKNGLMLGARSISENSRNFISNLVFGLRLAEKLDTHLTVIDEQNICSRLFPSKKLRLIKQRLKWPDYLNELEKHRIILNMDHTFTIGQVVTDSCFVGTLCFGGASESQKLLFPELGYQKTDLEKISHQIMRCYRREKTYLSYLTKARRRFKKNFTYENFQKDLKKTLEKISH